MSLSQNKKMKKTRPDLKTKPGTLESGAHNSSFSPQSVCVGSSRFWQPQDMCGPLLVTQSATSVVQLPPPPPTSMPTHTHTHTHTTCMHQSQLCIFLLCVCKFYFERTDTKSMTFITFFLEIWDKVSCFSDNNAFYIYINGINQMFSLLQQKKTF